MDEINETENLAQTIAREVAKPVVLEDFIATPKNYNLTSTEYLRRKPFRKNATVKLNDCSSFIEYVKRHSTPDGSTVWCHADYAKSSVTFLAVLNDLLGSPDGSAWRDHQAHFSPFFSEEWKRWFSQNKQPMTQVAFAEFLEENLKDVVGSETSASGNQILDMALAFEAKQDLRFKSAIRLQNGSTEIAYCNDDDAATLQKMQMFDRFDIGIPVFWGGDAYRITARLRYRAKDAKVNFWIELIRADKTLEAATDSIIATIKEQTGLPLFFGNAFHK